MHAPRRWFNILNDITSPLQHLPILCDNIQLQKKVRSQFLICYFARLSSYVWIISHPSTTRLNPSELLISTSRHPPHVHAIATIMSSITGLGIREKTKGGWHPKGKDGKSKESWRGDFKGVGQVAGWMGKSKNPVDEANSHISRPLHTLKDPNAFGPPPKNVNYHGGAALPNQITPDRSGLGAPLSRAQIQAEQDELEAQQEAEQQALVHKPAVPYRSDTTGLSTNHLPPPPGRRDTPSIRSPPPTLPPTASKGKPPGLPPRLPPRQNSTPIASPPPPQNNLQTESDPARGVLNRGALGRLGKAGISVPDFGIGAGTTGKAPVPPTSPTRTPVPAASNSTSPQVNELQSRFSRLSSSTGPATDAPSQGTTFAQKQAAFKTASSFHNDPSSISLNDARTAASTANNFRDRHGEQVKSGWQSANQLNKKYGIADKVNSYAPGTAAQVEQPANPQGAINETAVGPPSVVGKKKPPPPPVKRSGLSGNSVVAGSLPPPVPLASKPKPLVSRV